MGGRGSRPKMTKCDNGERGSKMSTFGVTYFFVWHLYDQTISEMQYQCDRTPKFHYN